MAVSKLTFELEGDCHRVPSLLQSLCARKSSPSQVCAPQHAGRACNRGAGDRSTTRRYQRNSHDAVFGLPTARELLLARVANSHFLFVIFMTSWHVREERVPGGKDRGGLQYFSRLHQPGRPAGISVEDEQHLRNLARPAVSDTDHLGPEVSSTPPTSSPQQPLLKHTCEFGNSNCNQHCSPSNPANTRTAARFLPPAEYS